MCDVSDFVGLWDGIICVLWLALKCVASIFVEYSSCVNGLAPRFRSSMSCKGLKATFNWLSLGFVWLRGIGDTLLDGKIFVLAKWFAAQSIEGTVWYVGLQARDNCEEQPP